MPFQPSSDLAGYAETIVKRYPERRSAIMMILHFLQKEQGRISLEAQEWVAEFLGIAPIQVREVVSFYPFYREHPIGKRHIRVCRTLSCALNGGYKVCDTFKSEFGAELDDISPDGRVTVEFAECLASCGTGPVALVDDELHENLTPEKVADICARLKEETAAVAPGETVDDARN